MGDHLDVTPDSLRTAADAYSTASGDVLGAVTHEGPGADGARIAGYQEHTAHDISREFFEPGALARSLLTEALTRYGTASKQMQKNTIGLSSALHILADTYHSADHEEALRFAFLETDDRPAGLPTYVDGSVTTLDEPEPADDDGTELLDDSGDTEDPPTPYTVENSPPALGSDVQSHSETVRLNEDGTIAAVEHQVVYDDGSVEYYTDTYSGGTDYERSESWEVSEQPTPLPRGTAMERDFDALEERYPDL